MLQKETKYLCACVYNIYIYIYTHTIYVFLLNVFLWDFNQNRDKQAFHINAFNPLQTFEYKSHSTCSLTGKMCVERVSVCVCVCTHTCSTCLAQSAPHLWRRTYSFTKIFLIQIPFGWFSIRSLARDIDGSSSASLISSWIFFVFFFKQLFETTGILSIISWKFVVICLKYNWLYTVVLTFQTALSTFILITHLCIDFSFKNACCERHRYPVCVMWKKNALFCKGTFKYCCKYLDRGCWTLKKINLLL